MGFWVLLILIILVVGTVPSYGYSRSWGYGPIGILGLLLVVWLILILIGTIQFSWPWVVATSAPVAPTP